MSLNTHPQLPMQAMPFCRPLTAPELTSLEWKVGDLLSACPGMADSWITMQAVETFKKEHNVPGTSDFPSFEYALKLTQQSRAMLSSTPSRNFDLTPTPFINQELSEVGLGLDPYNNLSPFLNQPNQNQQNIAQTRSLNDQGYNQKAFGQFPDFFQHNMSHHADSVDGIPAFEAPNRNASVTPDDVPQEEMPLDVDGDHNTIESHLLPKPTSRRNGNKNIFYPNQVTAMNLFGKSTKGPSKDVEEQVHRNPSLAPQRVKLLGEARSAAWNALSEDERKVWIEKATQVNSGPPNLGTVSQRSKLLKAKLLQLQDNAEEALSISVLSIAFLPSEGYGKPKATIFDCFTEGRPSFTRWLKDTHGAQTFGLLMAHLEQYANVVDKPAAKQDGDEQPDKAVDMEVEQDGRPAGTTRVQLWRDGIRYLSDPYDAKAVPLRGLYREGIHDRWLATGHCEKRMPWGRVEDKPENFILPALLDEGYVIKDPEKHNTTYLRKVVQFFVDHQEGRIPWEKGLVFMECGSGSTLHYPLEVDEGATAALTSTASGAEDAPANAAITTSMTATAATVGPSTNATATVELPSSGAATIDEPSINTPATVVSPSANTAATTGDPSTSAPTSAVEPFPANAAAVNATTTTGAPSTSTPASVEPTSTNNPASTVEPSLANVPSANTVTSIGKPSTNAPASTVEPSSANVPTANAAAVNATTTTGAPSTNTHANVEPTTTNNPASIIEPSLANVPFANTITSTAEPSTNAPACAVEPSFANAPTANAAVTAVEPSSTNAATTHMIVDLLDTGTTAPSLAHTNSTPPFGTITAEATAVTEDPSMAATKHSTRTRRVTPAVPRSPKHRGKKKRSAEDAAMDEPGVEASTRTRKSTCKK